MLLQTIVFYIFASLLLGNAAMVILSKNPVRAVLFLIATFFCASVLWMLLQAEFLALVLIFVYVGAVMTLLLFVVMMLNIDIAPLREGFVRTLPVALLAMGVLMGVMLYMFVPKHFELGALPLNQQAADYSNTAVLGQVLYTRYLLPFELAGVLLLVSIVAAISLAFHGRKSNTKAQVMAAQHAVRKKDRLHIVKMESDV